MSSETQEKQRFTPRKLVSEAYRLAGIQQPDFQEPVKKSIAGLINRLGFERDNPALNSIAVFQIQDSQQFGGLVRFASEAFSNGMKVTMRLNTPSSLEKPGGLTTVILDEEMLREIDQKPGTVQVTNTEGDVVVLSEPASAELFLREKSPEVFVSGLDPNGNVIKTNIGGGFRLSLESVDPTGSRVESFGLHLRGLYSFGDGGPRNIETSPRSDIKMELPIVKGGLVLPDNLLKSIHTQKEEIALSISRADPIPADTISHYMLNRFLIQNYFQATHALLLSYAQLPQSNTAQLEGKWMIASNKFPENTFTPTAVVTDLEGAWTVAGVAAKTGHNPYYTSGDAIRMGMLAMEGSGLKSFLPVETSEDLVKMANTAYLRSIRASL